MTRFNDFIQTEITHRQDVDDILTYDSETADVYRVGTDVENAGFENELSEETLIKRIPIKLGFLGSDGDRFEYLGLVADEDMMIDDLLVVKGESYRVTKIKKETRLTELFLVKKL